MRLGTLLRSARSTPTAHSTAIDNQSISFLPAIASTSTRIQAETSPLFAGPPKFRARHGAHDFAAATLFFATLVRAVPPQHFSMPRRGAQAGHGLSPWLQATSSWPRATPGIATLFFAHPGRSRSTAASAGACSWKPPCRGIAGTIARADGGGWWCMCSPGLQAIRGTDLSGCVASARAAGDRVSRICRHGRRPAITASGMPAQQLCDSFPPEADSTVAWRVSRSGCGHNGGVEDQPQHRRRRSRPSCPLLLTPRGPLRGASHAHRGGGACMCPQGLRPIRVDRKI